MRCVGGSGNARVSKGECNLQKVKSSRLQKQTLVEPERCTMFACLRVHGLDFRECRVCGFWPQGLSLGFRGAAKVADAPAHGSAQALTFNAEPLSLCLK